MIANTENPGGLIPTGIFLLIFIMTEQELEQLKYPIGRFKRPDGLTKEERRDSITFLRHFPKELRHLVASLNKDQLDTPYRPGGWSVRLLLHHIPDSHLNAYIRFKWALTEDEPVIKAYFEDRWAAIPYLSTAEIEESLLMLEALHDKWCNLMEHLREEDWTRKLIHPSHQLPLSLNDMLAMYHWHSKHHYAHIEQLLFRNRWR